MSSERFREIRESLGFTQQEISEVLGYSSKNVVTHIERGARNPGKLAMAVLELLNELPPRKAQELIERLRVHIRDQKMESDA